MSHHPWTRKMFDLALPFIEDWKRKHSYYKEWNMQKDRKAIDVRWVSEQTYQLNANAYVRVTDEELKSWIAANWINDEPGFEPSKTNTVLVVSEVLL